MKKVLLWIAIILGGLVVAAALAVGGLVLAANARLDKTYTVPADAVTIPTDAESLARGQHIVTSVCVGCHGENLAGKAVMNAPGFAVVSATNLTRGSGGVGGRYTDANWVQAIRHGVDPDGKSLLLMPSPEFYNFSDADLGAVIATIKSVPPVDNTVEDPQFSVMAKVLLVTGGLGAMDVASAINQTGPRPAAPQPGVTAAYGSYLVSTHECHDCHGPTLVGGKNPDPSGPPVPNITRANLSAWQETDFVKALRTGALPGGKTLNTGMPWQVLGRMTDDELSAIWLYLQTLPAPKSFY